MVKTKKRFLFIILIVVTLLALTVSGVIIFANKSGNKTLMLIDGHEVKEDEYKWAMNRCRNKVLQELVQSGEKVFDWHAETEEGIPYEILSDRAVEFLKELHAVHDVALGFGYLDKVGFKSLKERFEAANKAKAEDKANGKVVHGLSQYNFDQYVDYELDAILEQYCANKDNLDNTIEESELLKIYNDTKDSLYILEDDVELSYIRVDYISNEIPEDELNNLRNQMHQLSAGITESDLLEEELSKFPDLKMYHENQAVAGSEISQYSRVIGDILEYSSSLAEGEISTVIEQNSRIFLIQCVKRTDNDYIPFDEIFSVIEKQIQENRYEQLIQSKIDESVVEYNSEILYTYTMKKI